MTSGQQITLAVLFESITIDHDRLETRGVAVAPGCGDGPGSASDPDRRSPVPDASSQATIRDLAVVL